MMKIIFLCYFFSLSMTGTYPKTDSAHKSDKDKDKKDKEKEERDEGMMFYIWQINIYQLINKKSFPLSETIKVFDGNCSLRRRIFRAITVPRTCSLEQLLMAALRAFHITRDPNVS